MPLSATSPPFAHATAPAVSSPLAGPSGQKEGDVKSEQNELPPAPVVMMEPRPQPTQPTREQRRSIFGVGLYPKP